MFGYVIANLEGLTQPQKDRYKGCYCGLCRVLKQRHGFSGRLTLTYDMTFLVLLLSALYEADEERGMELCPAHPLRRHFYWQTRYTDYAADMNVVLAYYNCRDDWQDDGSALKYWESEALSRQCAAARARWPRQCAVIEQCMAQLGEIEQADTGDMDAAANCFGRLMGELFVTGELWDARLRPFGEALGRFIYLLDAVIDLPEDRRHGRYNPLRALPQDADLVFDVRCLPNPYYVPELKEHDGTEGPVRDYVMNAPESHEMLQKLEELLAFSIPLYQREGKSQLVVAVGCTGGRHRSVAIACQLAAYLRSLGYRVELSHRDKDNRR